MHYYTQCNTVAHVLAEQLFKLLINYCPRQEKTKIVPDALISTKSNTYNNAWNSFCYSFRYSITFRFQKVKKSLQSFCIRSPPGYLLCSLTLITTYLVKTVESAGANPRFVLAARHTVTPRTRSQTLTPREKFGAFFMHCNVKGNQSPQRKPTWTDRTHPAWESSPILFGL